MCLDICRIVFFKDGDWVYGSRIWVKVVKNKFVLLYCKCEFDIIFGFGIDILGELVDLGVDLGYCKKSGVWFVMGEQCLG